MMGESIHQYTPYFFIYFAGKDVLLKLLPNI